MKSNKLKKRVWAIILGIMLIQSNTVFAQAFDGNCNTLNKPETYNSIVTVIEEPITSQSGTGKGYIECMRRTCCETDEGGCKDISNYDSIKNAEKEIAAASAKQQKTQSGTSTGAGGTGTSTNTSSPQQAMRKCYSDYQSTSNCTPSSDITGPTVTSCKRVGIFYAQSGAELLYVYIGAIYRWAASIIGIICVFITIWGGIEIATAGDQSGKIDEAKKRIMSSLTGLVLLFMSAIILYTINPNFFVF